MPFYLRVPLPGPVSYSHRIGGRRHRHGGGLIVECFAWAIIGPLVAAWLLIKWTVLAIAWIARSVASLIANR